MRQARHAALLAATLCLAACQVVPPAKAVKTSADAIAIAVADCNDSTIPATQQPQNWTASLTDGTWLALFSSKPGAMPADITVKIRARDGRAEDCKEMILLSTKGRHWP